LGGPRWSEQRPDTSDVQADVGRRADTTATEDEQSTDSTSEAQSDVGRRADTTTGDGGQGSATTSEVETGADRQADTGPGQRTTHIDPERAESYNSRWNQLKSEFVDDPRGSVRGADQLVGEVLDELEGPVPQPAGRP
jgi:hypothetical protein